MDKNNAIKTTGKPQKRIIGRPFKKGNNANPKGRPKGTGYIEQLREAIKTVEKEKGKKLFIRFVEQAFNNPVIMVALMRKVVPDMNQSEVKMTSFTEEYEKLSDKELINQANEIIKRTGSLNTNQIVN